jgi:competence protein ComEA
MAVERTISTNRKIVALMLLAGGALLTYAVFHSSKGTSISSWEPVNESLKAAIENLQNKHEPDFMKSSTIPSDYFSSKKEGVIKGNTKEAGASKEVAASEEMSKRKSDNGLTIENKATQDHTSMDEKSSSIQEAAIPAATESSALLDPALLDLNHASQVELETLPGIGPSKAKAIISFREQHNGFNSLEQLLDVKGIGPKALERLSKLVRISTTK